MSNELDQELAAMSAILSALEPLDEGARTRVIKYVFERMQLAGVKLPKFGDSDASHVDEGSNVDSDTPISASATKWLRRNTIAPASLHLVYALDSGNPELIATKIPGDTTKQKMRNIALLLGTAQYVTEEQGKFSDATLRETCKHYDAYDTSNYTAYLKAFSHEVAGNKETGYHLTARGLTSAASLLKQVVGAEKNAGV